MTKQPRRIPWGRWLLYACGALMVLSVGVYLWLRSYSTITVAKETTFLTAPLAADGYPDYIAYLNELNSAGITPENNAWIPLLLGMDSGEIDESDRARHCQQLKIHVQGLAPGAFQPFSSRRFRESVSPELLVASSAAAQPAWYVEPVRLAVYNAFVSAERDLEIEALIPDEVPADERPLSERILDFAQTFSRDAAEAIAELAENPDAALARYDLMLAEEIPEPHDPNEFVPDLRAAALQAQEPAGLTPEEIEEWRINQITLARERLFEREELIINTRPWSRAECPLAAHWLETQSAALDRLLEQLAERPRFYAPYLTPQNDNDDGSAFSILLPGPQTLRQLQYGLQARAFAALHEGDVAAAIRDFKTELRISTIRPATPFLIDSLMSVALHKFALQTLTAIVHDPRMTTADLEALAKLLEQPYAFPDFAKCLQTERIAAVDFIVSSIAREKEIAGMPGFGNNFMRYLVCWDDVLRHLNELYDRAEVAAKKKDNAAIQQLRLEIETRPTDLPNVGILPSQSTAIIKYQYARMLVGTTFIAFQNALKLEARHDTARVMIALERYRRAQNAYPAALAELVPTYLPAVPTDPFDGQPLRYLLSETGGYRAYSIGINGIDDGGTIALDQDGDVDTQSGDLVIGSPDQVPPKLNLAW